MRYFVVLLSLLAGYGIASAHPACNASAEHSQSYSKAIHVVEGIPEFQAWSGSNNYSVAFGAAVDKQILIAGSCYWSVSVYANHPRRLELWHVFYVASPGGRVLIEDPSLGKPVSLQAWRKTNSGW